MFSQFLMVKIRFYHLAQTCKNPFGPSLEKILPTPTIGQSDMTCHLLENGKQILLLEK